MSSYDIIDFTSGIPDVSIAMLAYNHEKYIQEALDSVLMQRVNYSYKIILAEDKSTDKTRSIVLDYQKKYPDKIKLILQKENVGSTINNNDLLSNLEGRYVAALEGDDYWIDPLKLQKQVHFLEKNPDYGLSHTNFYRYSQNRQTNIKNKIPPLIKDFFYGLLRSHYPIGTLTTVFRKDVWESYITDVDPFSRDWLMGDLPLWLYISRFHKVHYLNEICAVYRVLEESASNTRQIDKMIRFDKSVKDVKLFFIAKYAANCVNVSDIKKEIETIFIYRQIIAFAVCKGNLKAFLSLLIQFHKTNTNLRYFLGSFKQILIRFS